MLDALDAPVIADSRNTVAAAVFSPAVDGKTLSFYKRHGVFFDKQTHSAWDLLGVSTAGPMAGKRLKPLPYTVSFAFAWLAFHPDTPVVLAPGLSLPEVGESLWPMSEMDTPAAAPHVAARILLCHCLLPAPIIAPAAKPPSKSPCAARASAETPRKTERAVECFRGFMGRAGGG